MIQLKCDHMNHQQSPVEAICLKKDCTLQKRACCIRCIPLHQDCGDYFKYLLDSFPETLNQLVILRNLFKNTIKIIIKQIEQLVQLVDLKFKPLEDYIDQPNLTNLNKLGDMLRVQKPQDIQNLEKHEKSICLILKQIMDILLNNESKQIISIYESLSQEDQAKEYYDKGFELFCAEQFQDAIINFDQAIQINKNDVNSWHWKGQSLFNLGTLEEARDCYDKSIKLDPKQNESYFWKGQVLLQLNNYNDALLCFDEQIKVQPSLDCYLQKGYTLEKLLNLKDAQKCYTEGLYKFPNNRELKAKQQENK